MRKKRIINNADKEKLCVGDNNILNGFEEKKKKYILEKDFNSLENLLQELFLNVVSNLNINNFNKGLIEICRKAIILFEDLKQHYFKVSANTFEIIPLLPNIYRLEKLADKLDEEIDDDSFDFEIDEKEAELERIEETVSFLIKIFNSYAQTYPNNIDVPDDAVLDFILAIENDWDFELLLIGLAKTKNPRVYRFLKDFENDEEKEVRELAKMLLIHSELKTSFSIKNSLKELIAEDQLVKSLEIMLDLGKFNNDIELVNEVYYQLGRYKRLEKDIRLGIINYQEINLIRNQIRYSIMELADKC